MKKTSTLIASLLLCFGISAQVNSSLNNSTLKAVNDKIMISGHDALNHLLINPNPNTIAVPNAKSANLTETVIGNTTYDLQSNACVQDRLIMHHNGSVSAAWTMSQQYNTSWSDRGSGYNYYDYNTGAWGNAPTMRLESSRCGWPSMLVMGSGK